MNKLERAAMQQALGALREYRDTQMIKSPRKAIAELQEALAEPDTDTMLWDSVEPRKKAEQEPSCNQHPDAPHGFARNASHNAGRYVCECEGWEPDQAEQEPVAWFVQYKNRHEFVFGNKPEFIIDGVVEPLYAAPVRTKDLTDDEIVEAVGVLNGFDAFRAVIAADREKNK